MKIEVYNEPWKHIIIDDTYDDTLLTNFIDECMRNLKTGYYTEQFTCPQPNVRHSPKNLYVQAQKDILLKNARDLLNSFDFDEWIIEKYFPEHRDYKKGSLTRVGETIFCWKGGNFPIHDEEPQKILSCTTYCDPASSHGTLIYDKDKNFVKEVEWKRNRTLIFAGLDDITWHSYQATDDSYRLTLNNFLKAK